MSFSSTKKRRTLILLLGVATLMALGGCNRAAIREQKAFRIELDQALAEHSYEKAAELARRLLKLKPQDEGVWDRLVQAQFGARNFAGATQALEEWRRAVSHPSPKLDEYTGDLAVAENHPAAALQPWLKVLEGDPKNVRVLEKVARLEHQAEHWTKENIAWTTCLEVQDNALARVHRALCRRRLHRWQDAFDDLHRAQELAPNDPEVLRAGKLFEQLDKSLGDIRELDAGLAVSPNDPGLLADRALLFLRGEDYALALEDSTEAAKFGPWATRPKLFQAIALIALGRPADCEKLAVQKFIRLETLSPEFLETISRLDSEISAERNNAELYVTRAWQLNEINQPALALQDAETAARLNPKSAGAFAEQSYALMKLGRAAEALQQIKHATELDSTYSTAWQYRGELEMDRGETLSAIESFSQVIETTQTVAALQKREECYRRLGLLVKAEQDKRALENLDARASK